MSKPRAAAEGITEQQAKRLPRRDLWVCVMGSTTLMALAPAFLQARWADGPVIFNFGSAIR